MKKYLDFILESSLDNLYLTDDKRFIVNENKFELFVDDTLVSSSRFVIEKPDKYFNEKYITLNTVKTYEKYQGKGFAKYLLEQIFDYVKNELKIRTIALIVDKDNYKEVNLYFKCGFEIFMEYEKVGYYSLIKKL